MSVAETVLEQTVSIEMRIPTVDGLLKDASFGIVGYRLQRLVQRHPLNLINFVIMIDDIARQIPHEEEVHDLLNSDAVSILSPRIPVIDIMV